MAAAMAALLAAAAAAAIEADESIDRSFTGDRFSLWASRGKCGSRSYLKN